MLAVAHRTPLTAAGCAALAAAGAGAYEVDVQLSARGVVVSHYFPLPVLRRVEHDNWRLRRARALGQDALLADVLALVPPDRDILLDLKETAPERRLALRERLAEQVPDKRRFVVSSERADDLAAMRRHGFRTWRTARGRPGLARLLAGPLDADGVSVRHGLLDGRTVAALRERTPCVVAWTVNGVGRARQLLALGATGITTDSAAVLSAVAATGPARDGSC
ncbi:MAG: glycerophosphodiester phosphodiesterase [Frankiaceae bacterium]